MGTTMGTVLQKQARGQSCRSWSWYSSEKQNKGTVLQKLPSYGRKAFADKQGPNEYKDLIQV